MLRQTNQQPITALYPRLSHEDELQGESNSISNHGHLLFEGTIGDLKKNASFRGYPTDNLEDTFLALIDEDNRKRGGRS